MCVWRIMHRMLQEHRGGSDFGVEEQFSEKDNLLNQAK